MSATPVGVVIADDQYLVRSGLAFRLNAEPSIHVLAEAHDAESAVQAVIEHKPSVAILDMEMPGRSIFGAVQEMRDLAPGLRVIFITAFASSSAIADAIQVNASGIVTKEEETDRLTTAIRSVVDGKPYYSVRVLERLEIGPDGVRLRQSAQEPQVELTLREREVLAYVARGMSKKDMASTMHLSVKTIENHTGALMSKLRIHNRVELTRYAIRHGFTQA